MSVKAEIKLDLERLHTGESACILVRPIGLKAGTHFSGTVTMTGARLVVNAKTRRARIIGDIEEDCAERLRPRKLTGWRRAYFNPNVTATYVDRETNAPVFQARAVYMYGPTVLYLP